MSQHKILVFTNFESLYPVIENDRKEKNLPLIQSNSLIGFDENTNSFTENFIDQSIILIQDSILEEDTNLQTLLGSINNEIVLILKHGLPGDALINIFKKSIVKTGRHAASGPYFDVFNFIFDDEINKYERIKNAIFPDVQFVISTEEKLTLLHNCLHPETASTADTSFLTEDQKYLVKKLIEIEDNFSSDYIDILTKLRISLLGS